MKDFKYRLIVILGVLGASFSAIIVQYSTAPSFVLAFYRMAFASLLMLPLVLTRGREELLALGFRQIGPCLLSGFFLALHFTAYFESLKFTSIASSTLLVDTEVFFVALVTVFIWREKIPRAGWIGIGLAFLGSIILALSDMGGGSDVLKGDALALAGAIFVMIYTLIGRSQRRGNMSTLIYTFLVYAAAALTLLLISIFSKTAITGYGGFNYVAGLLLTLLCTFLGHSVFSFGLKFVPAAFISTAKLGEPVFATLLGVILFGQIPPLSKIIGGSIILTGLYLYTRYGISEE